MNETQQPRRWRSKLLHLYMLGMILVPIPISLALLGRGRSAYTAMGALYAVMLVGLFVVLVLTPSTSKELDRVIDTEASTITLGMTFWGCWFYPAFESAFGAPRFHPTLAAFFIVVIYVLSKLVLRLKYRG